MYSLGLPLQNTLSGKSLLLQRAGNDTVSITQTAPAKEGLLFLAVFHIFKR